MRALDGILGVPTWIRSTSGAGYWGDRLDHWAQVLTLVSLESWLGEAGFWLWVEAWRREVDPYYETGHS